MICKNCGHDNDENDLFCQNCGKNLEKNNGKKINLSKNKVTESEKSTEVIDDVPTEENKPKINLAKSDTAKSDTSKEESSTQINPSQNGILNPSQQDTATYNNNNNVNNTVFADSILTDNIVTETAFCQNCGNKLLKTDRFCDRCGKSVAEEPAPPEYIRTVTETDNTPVKSKKKAVVITVVSLIGVIVICFVGYLVYQEIQIQKGAEEILSMLEDSSSEDSSDYDSANMQEEITTAKETVVSEKTTTTTKTTVKATAVKPAEKTYDVTFELDELLDAAGLHFTGHVCIAVLSNLTCSNGKAVVEVTEFETESLVYDNLVRVKVTGAEAGNVVISGTITTYGVDMVDGKTVSYPVYSDVFLIERTVGDNSSDYSHKTTTAKTAPSISGSITKQLSKYAGYDVYINVSGDYDYYDYKYYEASMPYDELMLVSSGKESSSSFRVSGFSAGVSYVYADITPYNNDGTAGKTITVRLDIDTDSKQPVKNNVTVSSCNKSGQINCHGGTVAGFKTSYVVEGGAVSKVRSSLGDKWHVTACNTCTSMGVTWYELYDSDDGDYYGWVDANYIDFGGSSSNNSNSSSSSNVSVFSCSKSGQINCHGGTVAGYTTSYVAEGGAVGKVRSSLGDKWHVTAYNTCTSMGVTWYELYDSDDGDYYGWVDSNYIDFY